MAFSDDTLQYLIKTLESFTNASIADIPEMVESMKKFPKETEKAIKVALNTSIGHKASAALSQHQLKESEDIMKQIKTDAVGALQKLVNIVSANAVDVIRAVEGTKKSDPDYEKRLQRQEHVVDTLGTTVKSIDKYGKVQTELNAKIDRYKEARKQDSEIYENLSFFEKIGWRTQKESKLYQLFNQYTKEYQEKYPTLGKSLAQVEATKRMRSEGLPSAQFLDPNYKPPGGSAAQRTDSDRFIDRLVKRLELSKIGTHVADFARDGAILATLMVASKAPPWLQKVLLGALALGIPQTLGPVIIDGIGKLAGNLLASSLGQAAIGFVVRTALPVVAGALLTTWGLSKIGDSIDKSATTKKQAEFGKGMLGGTVGLLGGAIAGALFLGGAPLWATLTAVGVTLASMWYGLQHFFGWYKEEAKEQKNEGRPSWLQTLIDWWQNHMPEFLGGGKGKTQIVGPYSSPLTGYGGEVRGGLGGGAYTASSNSLTGLYGGTFIDTKQYSKAQLNTMLAKNKAYESIAKGGKGWSTDAGSFINDVMFAARGTSSILNDVVAKHPEIAGLIRVTSAYGSASSGHALGANSHYVGEGKIDISGRGLSSAQARQVQKALESSGYFDWVNWEGDHWDVKVKESELKKREVASQSKKQVQDSLTPKVQPNKGAPLNPNFSGNSSQDLTKQFFLKQVVTEGK